jgi:hypothetical protein
MQSVSAVSFLRMEERPTIASDGARHSFPRLDADNVGEKATAVRNPPAYHSRGSRFTRESGNE